MSSCASCATASAIEFLSRHQRAGRGAWQRSAQARKLRTGQLQPEHRAECLADFARLVEESLIVLPVTGPDFRSAARFADRHETGLLAGDALHLAICAQHGARLVTLDKALATAATNTGVACLAQAEFTTPGPGAA